MSFLESFDKAVKNLSTQYKKTNKDRIAVITWLDTEVLPALKKDISEKKPGEILKILTEVREFLSELTSPRNVRKRLGVPYPEDSKTKLLSASSGRLKELLEKGVKDVLDRWIKKFTELKGTGDISLLETKEKTSENITELLKEQIFGNASLGSLSIKELYERKKSEGLEGVKVKAERTALRVLDVSGTSEISEINEKRISVIDFLEEYIQGILSPEEPKPDSEKIKALRKILKSLLKEDTSGKRIIDVKNFSGGKVELQCLKKGVLTRILMERKIFKLLKILPKRLDKEATKKFNEKRIEERKREMQTVGELSEQLQKIKEENSVKEEELREEKAQKKELEKIKRKKEEELEEINRKMEEELKIKEENEKKLREDLEQIEKESAALANKLKKVKREKKDLKEETKKKEEEEDSSTEKIKILVAESKKSKETEAFLKDAKERTELALILSDAIAQNIPDFLDNEMGRFRNFSSEKKDERQIKKDAEKSLKAINATLNKRLLELFENPLIFSFLIALEEEKKKEIIQHIYFFYRDIYVAIRKEVVTTRLEPLRKQLKKSLEIISFLSREIEDFKKVKKLQEKITSLLEGTKYRKYHKHLKTLNEKITNITTSKEYRNPKKKLKKINSACKGTADKISDEIDKIIMESMETLANRGGFIEVTLQEMETFLKKKLGINEKSYMAFIFDYRDFLSTLSNELKNKELMPLIETYRKNVKGYEKIATPPSRAPEGCFFAGDRKKSESPAGSSGSPVPKLRKGI